MPESAAVRVTVLTCTYNRSRTLPRLYQSLKEQAFRDFEWLIIDDGSTDGTRELVASWQGSNAPFPIRYHWKANGGKHSAHNFALPHLRGEYCAIIDSDDWYLPTGLRDLVEAWRAIPSADASAYACVEGLTQTKTGEILGSPFPEDVFDSDHHQILYQRAKHGDTRGMHRSAVLQEYPYPKDLDGEHVPPALVWLRLAKRYRSRFINKVIGYAEYQPGGLSDFSVQTMLASLRSRRLFLQEQLELSARIPLFPRIRLFANYLRLSLHAGEIVRPLRAAPAPLLCLAVLPLALALYGRDTLLCNRSSAASRVTGLTSTPRAPGGSS